MNKVIAGRSYRGLVADMLRQAITTVEGEKKHNRNTNTGPLESLVWLYDQKQGFGSFRWCCEMLDLDPDVVKWRLKERWIAS